MQQLKLKPTTKSNNIYNVWVAATICHHPQ